MTILDLSLAVLVAAALTAAGALLVSGPTEDREELGRQVRFTALAVAPPASLAACAQGPGH